MDATAASSVEDNNIPTLFLSLENRKSVARLLRAVEDNDRNVFNSPFLKFISSSSFREMLITAFSYDRSDDAFFLKGVLTLLKANYSRDEYLDFLLGLCSGTGTHYVSAIIKSTTAALSVILNEFASHDLVFDFKPCYYMAARCGETARIKALIEHDPSPVWNISFSRHMGLFDFLLLDSPLKFTLMNSSGTELPRKLEILDVLLSHCDLSATDSTGFTPLAFAIFVKAPLPAIKLLVEKGSPLNSVSESSISPLAQIVSNDPVDLELLRYFLNLEGVNIDGPTSAMPNARYPF